MEFFGLQLSGGNLSAIAEQREPLPIRFSLLHERNFVHRLALSLTLILLIVGGAVASGTTQIVDAKIAEVTERGFILQVGKDSLQVEDTGSTKFWKKKAAAKRESFATGDAVTVRIKTNVDPPEAREFADRESWAWLEKIRKEPMAGTIEKLDDRYLTLKFSDGSTFAYRATDKSKVEMKGKPDCKLADLEPGSKVYAKGRTLATLDIWLVSVTDTAPEAKPTATKTKKSTAKPKAIPASGKLEGMVLSHLPQYKMFDIVKDAMTYHITYTSTTKWFLDSKPAKPTALNRDLRVEVSYSRDKFGRIIASKVELFGR